MLLYIFKSTAILVILLFFYKLFLERENMHMFKRFYLLGSLVLSLVIPALVFTEYLEAIPYPETSNSVIQQFPNSNDVINVPPALESDLMDIAPILWTIYFLGLLYFGLKFIRNLFQIFRRIRRNPKYRLNRFTQVLLKEKIPPHTFFSYIFLNKTKLESNQIPKEVILHEETHAQQKHSYDVVFVEFLQVILWVNPLVFFFKKAIKLNHEFLADQAVLKKDIDKATYQNTLLSYLSNDSDKEYQPKLVNAINYSSIKKRFTVMKTKTSKKAIVLRSLFLIPLLAIILYGFSEKEIVEIPSSVEISNSSIDQSIPTETIEIGITQNGEIHIQDGTFISMENLKSYLLNFNTHLTKEQRSNTVRALIKPDADPPLDLLADIEAILVDYGVAQVNIIGHEEYSNPDKINVKREELTTFIVSVQKNKNSIRLKCYTGCKWADITLDTKANSRYIINDYGFSESKTLETDKFAFSIEPSASGVSLTSLKGTAWSDLDFSLAKNQEQFINEYGMLALENNKSNKNKTQDGATKLQLKEYNALAKKYNRQLSKDNSIQIFKSDVERLEYLHGLMSHEQKENAEPFPDFPEPPPVPEAPEVKEGEMSNIPPPPAPMVRKGEKSDIPLHPKAPKATKEPNAPKGKKSNLPPPPPSVSNVSDVAHADRVIEDVIAHQDPYDVVGGSVLFQDSNGEIGSILSRPTNYKGDFNYSKPSSKQSNWIGLIETDSNFELPTSSRFGVKMGHNSNPIPPPPKPPLDHVIEMAKKDAQFYYEGKKISSDKAIDILKKNKSINIDTRGSGGNRPTVRLSKNPIIIKK